MKDDSTAQITNLPLLKSLIWLYVGRAAQPLAGVIKEYPGYVGRLDSTARLPPHLDGLDNRRPFVL